MNESNISVMIVDDDINCLQSLKNALSLNGFQVKDFDSPHFALQRYRPPNPKDIDAVVTDYRFPGSKWDGIRLMEEIKKIEPDAPVIIISGATIPDLPERCLKAGALAFLSKPIDVGELIEKLETIGTA